MMKESLGSLLLPSPPELKVCLFASVNNPDFPQLLIAQFRAPLKQDQYLSSSPYLSFLQAITHTASPLPCFTGLE